MKFRFTVQLKWFALPPWIPILPLIQQLLRLAKQPPLLLHFQRSLLLPLPALQHALPQPAAPRPVQLFLLPVLPVLLLPAVHLQVLPAAVRGITAAFRIPSRRRWRDQALRCTSIALTRNDQTSRAPSSAVKCSRASRFPAPA